MSDKKREAVLIIEDHAFVAEATEYLISKNKPDLAVLVRNTAEDALNTLRKAEFRWQLILLDLDVPGAVGLSLAMEIKNLGLQGSTCILTGTFRKDFVAHAKANGFLGYVLKATATKGLDEVLQKVMSGERVFFEDSNEKAASPSPTLTQRQLEILNLVALGKSSKEVAKVLGMQPRTVDKHLEAVMIELGVSRRAHAVQKGLQLGILRVTDHANSSVSEQ